jgi:hypothetical protein
MGGAPPSIQRLAWRPVAGFSVALLVVLVVTSGAYG